MPNVPEFFVGGKTPTFLASRALCNLDHSSIVVLMAMKSLICNCCLDIELTHELLRECKKATMNTLRAPPHNLNALLSRESACAIALLKGVVHGAC